MGLGLACRCKAGIADSLQKYVGIGAKSLDLDSDLDSGYTWPQFHYLTLQYNGIGGLVR